MALEKAVLGSIAGGFAVHLYTDSRNATSIDIGYRERLMIPKSFYSEVAGTEEGGALACVERQLQSNDWFDAHARNR